MKRFLLFFQDGTRWVFVDSYDHLAQAQHYTGLVVHCMIVDSDDGIRYERLSPRGSWHEHETAAA